MVPSFFPAPKFLIIPVLEPFELISGKNSINDVGSTTFTNYPRLPPSNSVYKQTTTSSNNLIDTSSETTIQPPRHRYNVNSNRNVTPSLASTNSTL